MCVCTVFYPVASHNHSLTSICKFDRQTETDCNVVCFWWMRGNESNACFCAHSISWFPLVYHRKLQAPAEIRRKTPDLSWTKSIWNRNFLHAFSNSGPDGFTSDFSSWSLCREEKSWLIRWRQTMHVTVSFLYLPTIWVEEPLFCNHFFLPLLITTTVKRCALHKKKASRGEQTFSEYRERKNWVLERWMCVWFFCSVLPAGRKWY